jgi:hypothetical protein
MLFGEAHYIRVQVLVVSLQVDELKKHHHQYLLLNHLDFLEHLDTKQKQQEFLKLFFFHFIYLILLMEFPNIRD